jgi:hypothetical protein
MRTLGFALLLALAWSKPPAMAQTTPPADAPRVFLDCNFCDETFIRTEINWVNWVRDRADAHVHVLITHQETGGGGSDWSLNFIGLKEFQGKADTLRWVSSQNSSEDDVRKGMTRALKLGLAPFILNTSLGPRLQISMAAPSTNEAQASTTARTNDPWNFWVFSLSARSNLNGESSHKYASFGGNVSANRTTASWKLRAGINGNYNENSFTYPVDDIRDTTVVSITRSYNLNLLAVRSFGAHWAAGVQSGATSATYGNISLGLSGGPAIEYSYWPYDQATRRSLVLRYSAGVRSFDYREITIFNEVTETHPAHSLTSELSLRQPWGSTYFSTNFRQYLHNTKFYNASMFGNANVRLFKGFSLDIYGEYARVRDQLSLALRQLSPDEVLLRQQQLQTGYRYWGGMGIRYSFGSIFNNVVNPRFGDGGGGIIISN